jgi:murein DD-endopeptidase MepM/ murein hydrolase activator NlpD
VTSPFGYRIHPTLGIRKLHTGVDLGVSVGTQVRAVSGGVVRRASEDRVNGKVLVIDHGRGVSTAYCHNSDLLVSAGQRVDRGAVVALSGSSGRSTGPHLHYQLELGHEPFDPLGFRGAGPQRQSRRPRAW